MSVKFPQIDYPRGSLPRGGSDIWDTPQASVVLADDMFASAGPAPTVLTGNNVASTATSTQGAISQTHALTGAASSQANTSATGAVGQTHVIAGANSAQANTSTTGAVGQTHVIAGANSAQANTSATGAVTQTHILTGDDCIQVNLGTTGKIGIDWLFRNPVMVLSSQGAEIGLREATTEMHLSAIDKNCGLLNAPLSAALTGQALDFLLTPKSTTIGAP